LICPLSADESFPPFLVSSKTLRIEIEAMNRKYFDVLSESIVTSANNEIANLDASLRSLIDSLRHVPQTPDDVCNAVDYFTEVRKDVEMVRNS